MDVGVRVFIINFSDMCYTRDYAILRPSGIFVKNEHFGFLVVPPSFGGKFGWQIKNFEQLDRGSVLSTSI